MDGYLPVKVHVPLDDYRHLNARAESEGLTVATLIARMVTLRRFGGGQPGSGRRSGYTTQAGEEIAAGRRFNMSWPEIARQIGVSDRTAREWAKKYEAEVREQNARYRAERKTA